MKPPPGFTPEGAIGAACAVIVVMLIHGLITGWLT